MSLIHSASDHKSSVDSNDHPKVHVAVSDTMRLRYYFSTCKATISGTTLDEIECRPKAADRPHPAPKMKRNGETKP